jgi:uncharacterized protein (TIGR02646 family)
MLTYLSGPLSAEAEARLADLQAEVDSEPDHARRYMKANRSFSNKKNKTFDEVRARLASMSPPGMACFYCERDRYRDIDHIKPKRHYPGVCFHWTNYVYACSKCNQDAKKDKYAVIDGYGNLKSFDRSWPIELPVPTGIHALIDIRRENPLDFLILDLETGRFVPISSDQNERQRAIFTRDLFNLDSDDLSRMRRQAKHAFIDYISRYRNLVLENKRESALRMLAEIKELPHPTVLLEMRRQKDRHDWLPPLIDLLPDTI